MKHLRQVCLKNHCTYRIGGLAQDFFLPANKQELVELVLAHRADQRPFWILGGGSNTLFPDHELSISIIATKEMNACTQEGHIFHAESGIMMDKWIVDNLRRGFGGHECLSGIPGTLGGALFMNAGAYGQEISQHLIQVTILTPENEIQTIPYQDCGFGYRQAKALQQAIILDASWQLPKANGDFLLAQRKKILSQRRAKQPLNFPSAGSVFKRPPGAYASQLMDQAGLKGVRIGDAQVSEKHAGFIVNIGNATSQDVLELIKLCQQKVRDQFGYDLELEQCLGPIWLNPQEK